MRLFFLFLVLVFSFSHGQKLYKIDTLRFKNLSNIADNNYYAVEDGKELLYYIKKSDKRHKVIFTFTYWCRPCREKHPHILALNEEFKDADFFYLSNIYGKSQFSKTSEYLKSINSSAPIFTIIHNEKNKNSKGKYEYFIFDYKRKKRVKSDRYMHFTQKLIPGHWYYGYSLIIVYDQVNKPVYASTYNEADEEIFRKLRKILSE